jgi:hypothetical protein
MVNCSDELPRFSSPRYKGCLALAEPQQSLPHAICAIAAQHNLDFVARP